MAIVGLTHDEDGKPLQRLAVTTKISIGEAPNKDRNYPQKLDYFHALAKDTEGKWVPHRPLMKKLRTRAAEEMRRNGASVNDDTLVKIHEIEIVFLSDDPDEVFRTEYAKWGASEKLCCGHGVTALRSINDKAVDAATAKQYEITGLVPWAPCGKACSDLRTHQCKPSGRLFFMITADPVLGTVAVFSTTSFESVSRVSSSLQFIKETTFNLGLFDAQGTGGRLRGIPLRLVLKPGKTRYKDASGKTKSGTAFFCHIEFRAEEWKRLFPKLLEEGAALDQARQLQAERVKLIGSGTTAASTAYDEEEPIGAEEDVPEETNGFREKFSALCDKLWITPAKRQLLLRSHAGDDIEALIAFLSELAVIAAQRKATANQVNEWIERGGATPEQLLAELYAEPKSGEPVKEEAQKKRRAKKTEPSQPEPEPQPETEAAAKPNPWSNF